MLILGDFIMSLKSENLIFKFADSTSYGVEYILLEHLIKNEGGGEKLLGGNRGVCDFSSLIINCWCVGIFFIFLSHLGACLDFASIVDCAFCVENVVVLGALYHIPLR